MSAIIETLHPGTTALDIVQVAPNIEILVMIAIVGAMSIVLYCDIFRKL